MANAQSADDSTVITGTVRRETNETLMNVSIRFNDQAVASDRNGNFRIAFIHSPISADKPLLITFSYPGFDPVARSYFAAMGSTRFEVTLFPAKTTNYSYRQTRGWGAVDFPDTLLSFSNEEPRLDAVDKEKLSRVALRMKLHPEAGLEIVATTRPNEAATADILQIAIRNYLVAHEKIAASRLLLKKEAGVFQPSMTIRLRPLRPDTD